MAEPVENLIAYIKAAEAFEDIHVGEVVPNFADVEYVFLQQSDETESEALDVRDAESIGFDCEIGADDIAVQRSLVKALKTRIKELPSWSSDFDNLVEYISVDDHGDDYQPKTIDGSTDDIKHLSAVLITLHF